MRKSRDEFGRPRVEVSGKVAVTPNTYIEKSTASFEGELLDGPRAFLSAFGQNADAVRHPRQFLVDKAGPAYKQFAGRAGAGADAAAGRPRFTERVESLDALIREIESSSSWQGPSDRSPADRDWECARCSCCP